MIRAVYAIYYTGDFPSYERLQSAIGTDALNCQARQYPRSKEGHQDGASRAGHAESIRAATNLNLADFFCRYLVVDDIWIPLGKSLLIARFSPLWNFLINGFGNHDPGAGRYQGMRPRWDTIHPGRGWAANASHEPKQLRKSSLR